jgi:hypothetical protein
MTDARINVVPLPVLHGFRTVPAESRAAMRAAVVQAVKDLFIAHVPFHERSALFEVARDLLPQCGWSPLEMIEAAEPGPRQEALFEEFGLQLGSSTEVVTDA